MTKVICVIPARYASSRLPAKPLADVCGKPLIQRVYERALTAGTLSDILVATDDDRILQAVNAFGGRAVMTSSDFQSGTDRIASAVRDIPADIIVNLQGDEPLMHPDTIDAAVNALIDDTASSISTPMIRITGEKDYLAPSVVKVVTGLDGIALYFSRSPIPSKARVKERPEFGDYWGFKHLGLYVYRREALMAFPGLKPTRLERLEQLEQLRFLENGYRIRMVETVHDSIGIDTPSDLEELCARISP